MMDETEAFNFQLFRECLSTPLIQKSTSNTNTPVKQTRKARGGRKNAIKPVVQAEEDSPNDAEELGEFIDVCSQVLDLS